MRTTNWVKNLKSLLLTMPKERAHLPVLKAVRSMKKAKAEGVKYPPGSVALQVLGNTLYLFTDQNRYLFNCGEGTQRLAHEHKVKLGKLDGVFLTSTHWNHVGGLPGVILTVQDIGLEQVNITGPPGINHIFNTTRRFVILNSISIQTINTLKTKYYEDHVISVHYINISDGLNNVMSSHNDTDSTDYYKQYREKHGEKMISVSNEEGEKEKGLCVCYGVHLSKKEGTLLIDKCVELGVKPGPLLGQLKSGKDVTLPDGRIVKAEQVRSEDCPGPVFLVMDCPTTNHLTSLLNNDTLKEYQTKHNTQIVIHFTPNEILQSKEYKSFLSQFRVSTQHLLINEELQSDGHEAVHRMQTKLNFIDPVMFPMFDLKEKKEKLDLDVLNIIGETGLKYGLRGRLLGQEMPTWKINTEEYVKELEETKDEIEIFKRNQQKGIQNYPIITFLGTGSSIPAKTRNVSSILIEYDHANVLLDCGEGTLSQLQRYSNFDQIMDNLKIIYISHLHADHHLGLFSFLKLKKLKVIAPKQILNWLESYSRDFDQFDFELCPAGDFLDSKTVDDLEIQTCYVKHCPNAFGVSITHKNEKITYSGDTLPCEELVRLGLNSNLLIHEATMEDGMEAEALGKMHSTFSQAVQIGKDMKAQFTILTHFSQRYSKVPWIDENVILEDVGLAFDNMRVSMGQLPRLKGLGKLCSEVWKEDVEEMDGRRKRKMLKKSLL